MKLLHTRRSPFARKVRVVALEKGITLDLVDEDLQNKSALLKKSNPIAKVPTLILPTGQALYDSKVITQYLEYIKPEPVLIPVSDKRFDVLKLEALGDDLVVNAIQAYMEKIRHPKDFNASFIAAQEHTIKETYAYFDANMGLLKDFHLGTINVACAIGYIQFRLPHIHLSPTLAAWFSTMSARDSFAKTVPVA